MESQLVRVMEQSSRPAYSRRITLLLNVLGPLLLVVGLVIGGYSLYLASYAADGYGPQFFIKDGHSGPSYVDPPDPVVMAKATKAAIQNYTLRVGQKSCQSETTCVVPQMVLPDPVLMTLGTIVTVRNGSIDTEATDNDGNNVSYISPPQKVSVKVGTTGLDYVVKGDMKSYIVLDVGGGPQWYHAGLPMEGWHAPGDIAY
jgi:hypothetical protein